MDQAKEYVFTVAKLCRADRVLHGGLSVADMDREGCS